MTGFNTRYLIKLFTFSDDDEGAEEEEFDENDDEDDSDEEPGLKDGKIADTKSLI